MGRDSATSVSAEPWAFILIPLCLQKLRPLRTDKHDCPACIHSRSCRIESGLVRRTVFSGGRSPTDRGSQPHLALCSCECFPCARSLCNFSVMTSRLHCHGWVPVFETCPSHTHFAKIVPDLSYLFINLYAQVDRCMGCLLSVMLMLHIRARPPLDCANDVGLPQHEFGLR